MVLKNLEQKRCINILPAKIGPFFSHEKQKEHVGGLNLVEYSMARKAK